ncbi:MAG: glycoside hydrolase family 78 protein [Lachnospiraceae bacterium]|nr:glycoside hydrolase family 78 protein [Lachnospiraceae bacterium]
MRICDMTINHLTNPLGYHMDTATFHWLVADSRGKKTDFSRICVGTDENLSDPVYDSGIQAGNLSGYCINYLWKPSTRYFWQVTVTDDCGETVVSDVAWFETAKDEKDWSAVWITGTHTGNNLLYTRFTPRTAVARARLSITGVGLYEAYLNHNKIGDEYLTPNFNDYSNFIQFQTYELENEISDGVNELPIALGNGWYKGRYISFTGKDHDLYGDTQAALAELRLEYTDGSTETICTDTSWRCRKSPVLFADLYDGEILDDNILNTNADTDAPVCTVEIGYDLLEARRSLPVKKMLSVKPVQLIHSPKGESILDFGQNMAGWVKFYNRLLRNKTCRYVAGEILQDGCFYHENMRTAKTEFIYTSSGVEKWVRPHFTFYGFRYLLLEGFGDNIRLSDFEAEVLYSDMVQTGFMETGNRKVNQLISNILWGQRSNFIDVPTDCPQRDERMGWTGDTQIFSMTAMYNMNTANFFRKHMYDINGVQNKTGGIAPFVVPPLTFPPQASAGWGDVATIVPWNLYLMYGDRQMLQEQYPGMKAWADYIYSRDLAGGDTGLWSLDNHFGDWLSLDAPEGVSSGGTEITLVATAYYYHSTKLTALVAKELNRGVEYELYAARAEKIKTAYQNEYLTVSGRLTEHTQTACILTLYMGLYREGQEQRIADELECLILENGGHLSTGFLGTGYLCQVLSKFGKHKLACDLLLVEDYPGWLYSVNLGATTIWERWDSVLSDGHMNPEGMNSLNHYANGTVQEWMYQYIGGIRPQEPGWRKIFIAPHPDHRLGKFHAEYRSISGTVISEWQWRENGTIEYHFEIPFDTTAIVNFENEKPFELAAGVWKFTRTAVLVSKGYNGYTDLSVLLADEEARELILAHAPGLLHIPAELSGGSLKKQMLSVFSGYTGADYEKLIAALKNL